MTLALVPQDFPFLRHYDYLDEVLEYEVEGLLQLEVELSAALAVSEAVVPLEVLNTWSEVYPWT